MSIKKLSSEKNLSYCLKKEKCKCTKQDRKSIVASRGISILRVYNEKETRDERERGISRIIISLTFIV